MDIEININSLTPVYEQIVQQITQGVLSGAITPGTSMPAIRQLARDLGINTNTVAKAYKLLEAQHVTHSAGRNGTRIHENAQAHILQFNTLNAEIELNELVERFETKGLEVSEILDLLTKKMAQLKRK